MIFIYLMAGGSGSRLWPLSETHPKPLLKLLPNGKTILEETINRIDSLDQQTKIILGINSSHKKLFEDFLKRKKIKNIELLVEPCARDTAAAIIYFSYCLAKGEYGGSVESTVLATPCDQVLDSNDVFSDAVNSLLKLNAEKKLMTIGIKPHFASTQYGYIKTAKEIMPNVFSVEKFIEKPNQKNAKKYVNDGMYWNSGTFLFSVEKIIKSTEDFCPDLLEKVKKTFKKSKNKKEPAALFSEIPKISFDYAIVEREKDICMSKCDTRWRDLGNWKEVVDFFEEKGEIKNLKFEEFVSKNNTAISEKKVIFLGTEDLIVVDGPNGILVANKNSASELKKYIKKTKSDI
ncbi:hypothetical protein CL643_04010 [bacterium]|nr:hypothetical protein [bacterium]|tara:strand:- start:4307 stop:5347 length:1041 start_codon:yes stop_codon:yes gene_type:complete